MTDPLEVEMGEDYTFEILKSNLFSQNGPDTDTHSDTNGSIDLPDSRGKFF